MFCFIYLEILSIIDGEMYTGIEVMWLGKYCIASIKAEKN